MQAGKRLFIASLLACGAVSPVFAAATCTASAANPFLASEGLAERAGQINIVCTGGPAGAPVTGSLAVLLSVPVTNRISADNLVDAVLTAENGSGPPAPAAPATLLSTNTVLFSPLNLTLSPQGSIRFTISNLRGAASQQGLAGHQPVQAFVNSNLTNLAMQSQAPLNVGLPIRSLLAAFPRHSFAVAGSPLPAHVTYSTLLETGTLSNSVRVTEGFAGAFRKREAAPVNGTRLLLKYNGLPAGVRLFVPNAVAGSSAVQPTSSGDFGTSASSGMYAPGGPGSLLLARVWGADANGDGGVPSYTPGPAGSGTVTLNDVSELQVTNGTAFAVYEVLDSNPALQQSAQVPTFVGMPSTGGQAVFTKQTVSLAPVSTLAAASPSASIPRYVQAEPPLDCDVLNDCSAGYFPKLVVDFPALEFTVAEGTPQRIVYGRVVDDNNGLMLWNARVVYKTGENWIKLFPESGTRGATLRFDIVPPHLAPGRYEATLIVDAGPLAGSKTLPVSLTVNPAPPNPIVTETGNAADLTVQTLVAGSLATIKGLKLKGNQVTVAFDGIDAPVIFISDTQLNLRVPEQLASRATAAMVITVDGHRSEPQTVNLAAAAPAIFPGAVLNQDYSVNGTARPARAGSYLQIFATGLPLPGTGTITAQIHDRVISAPAYAGPAPGLPGVQQVNIQVPADLPAMTTTVKVCGAAAANPAQPVCSPLANVTLSR